MFSLYCNNYSQLHSLSLCFFKHLCINSCLFLTICSITGTRLNTNDVAMLMPNLSDFLTYVDNADSCSLNCVTFIKHNEILTGNLRGLMKIWDLRSPTNEPSNTFMFSSDQVAATCLTVHPTQRHMVVAGDEEGESPSNFVL